MIYLIVSGGLYINEAGEYGPRSEAKEFQDKKIARWLADYFGGLAVSEGSAEEEAEAYRVERLKELGND